MSSFVPDETADLLIAKTSLKFVDMKSDDCHVLISNRSKYGPAVVFFLMALVISPGITDKHPSNRYPAILLVCLGLIFVYRSFRAGYIRITSSVIEVRTILRRRTFALSDVDSVDTETLSQATIRVMPVLKLRDGSTYKLSEFFVQRRTFQKSPEDNLAVHVVREISNALKS